MGDYKVSISGGRAMETNETKPVKEPIVVHEFPQVGKYRVRVVRSSAGPRAVIVLDIREYAKAEHFEGFTRRGVRISSKAEAESLLESLKTLLAMGGLK